MTKFITLLMGLTMTFTLGCTHPGKNQSRIPATETAEAVKLETEMAELVESRDERRLKGLFTAARIAQSLVSSFDMRIAAASSEADMNEIFGSQLYCKLQKSRQLYESVQDKVDAALAISFQVQESDWMVQQIDSYIGGQADGEQEARIAALAHLIRKFHFGSENLCGSLDCRGGLSTLVAFPFDPLDDVAFDKYLSDNRVAIANYSKALEKDLEPGDCTSTSASKRAPNSLNYDWSKRNWIRSNTRPGEFVITYDDGPHSAYTERIMSLWERSQMALPSFFWLSKNVIAMPELARGAHERGFVIGSHSASHGDIGNLAKARSKSDLSRVNKKHYAAELNKVSNQDFDRWRSRKLDEEIMHSTEDIQTVIRKVDSNYRLKHFRLPYGSGVKNESIAIRFEVQDLDHFFWSVDSLDWQDSNSVSVLGRVLNQMKSQKRGLVLFHDIQKSTVKSTELLIDAIRKNNQYKAVSIRQMVP